MHRNIDHNESVSSSSFFVPLCGRRCRHWGPKTNQPTKHPTSELEMRPTGWRMTMNVSLKQRNRKQRSGGCSPAYEPGGRASERDKPRPKEAEEPANPATSSHSHSVVVVVVVTKK